MSQDERRIFQNHATLQFFCHLAAPSSKELFDQCLANEALFDKIVQTRKIAHEKFQVDSTPTFFIFNFLTCFQTSTIREVPFV